MEESPVIVGKITGVHGVQGWVKVFSHTEPRLNIVKYNPWLIKQKNEWRSIKLLNGRSQGKTIVAQLEGINDRNSAHAMIGTEIAIMPSQMQPLADNEFYWRDLEGLQVIDTQGETLGIVSHLIETGANDVLVVKLSAEKAAGSKEKEMMIPYIPESVIKKVDLNAQTIEVDWDNDY
ncbi:ribosome maturation factor RimM [Aliikangiella sp. IMCC44653]